MVTALLAGVLLALAAPSAGAQLPVGETDGVRIVRERGALVVVFTKPATRLWRRVAGKRVSVYCTAFLESGTGSGGMTYRVPKRGRRLHTGDLTRGIDYCRVWLEARKGRDKRGRGITIGRELIVSVPFTQVGARHLDTELRARLMLGVFIYAGLLAEKLDLETYPTPAQLLSGTRSPRVLGEGVVALASPAETPPGDAVGYWSDGAARVALVTVSALGKRLFVEYDADVLRTNVASFLFDDELD